ncbi:bifunctional DNA primase/polymerase [Streptomyces sp. NPDC059002]|uniref:bifunctional DNA primase/polymerase n=1 Tax=Streptomyces sp. NPDC059002 TaxID=3346690 RepID=UPI0036775A78
MSANDNAPVEAGARDDRLGGGSDSTVARQIALDGALWLVGRNFPVFPADHPGTGACTGMHRVCDGSRGKHPCVPFTREHTVDEARTRRWFGGQLRNVAVALGACSGPDEGRLLVVDSDRPGAIEDTAALLGHRHTTTMRVRTAKGHHDYYWAPASARLGNGLGALRGHFDGDIRSGNAYVIGPGSLHVTGVLYALEDPGQPPVPAPAWLLTALLHSAGRPAPATSRVAPLQATQKGLRSLVRFVLQAAPGERNNRLFWAACRAAEGGAANADRALVEAAVAVGLDEGAAAATVRSAYHRGGGTQ